MVDTVSFEKTTFNKVPFKFEAGTPNVGAALGLETAVKFIQSFDRQEVEAYEDELLEYATEQLANIEGTRFVAWPSKVVFWATRHSSVTSTRSCVVSPVSSSSINSLHLATTDMSWCAFPCRS